ncbi:hypothetical protein OG322_03990 [Streptomyces sp. NBC_01260]|uniref:hypothetical protein n=1 Tax=unclassified Streptomyces TaxID=2593676 RepID=UPI000FB39C62|nr:MULTISPECIES: hypothetical protein [unclassified Streptomyces]ROQ77292.1 hypothetical protein EDD95_3810 [Streptomyces sp. CEV 2-1]
MTPLPGASRGDAHRRDRPDTPAHRRRAASARQFLAALLLAVLTVAGGAPAAAAVPAGATTGPLSFAGHPAGARPAAPHPGRTETTSRTVGTHPVRTERTVRTDRTGRTPGAHDVPRPRTRAAAGSLRPAPVTVPRPWAAAEHPRPPQHLPPHGPGAPLPRPPGLPLPHPVPGCALAGPPAAADRFRTALPGVRGPPGTAVHRPWDLPPVPSRTPAVAP